MLKACISPDLMDLTCIVHGNPPCNGKSDVMVTMETDASAIAVYFFWKLSRRPNAPRAPRAHVINYLLIDISIYHFRSDFLRISIIDWSGYADGTF